MTHEEAIRDLTAIKEFFEQESGAYPVSLEYAIGVLKNTLEEVPSADRPQGEWTNAGVLTVHCSNCKSEFHELEAMNYCPNCGAKMKGADDEDA